MGAVLSGTAGGGCGAQIVRLVSNSSDALDIISELSIHDLLFHVVVRRCFIPESSKPELRDDVRVAVIRFQINEWLADESKSDSPEETHSSKETFFISVNDQDPSKEFMGCLSDLPGRIRYASEEGWRNFRMTDSQTGQYAVEFWVKKFRLTSPNIAEVETGHYCGMSGGAQIRFQLRRTSGHWRVTRKLGAVYE